MQALIRVQLVARAGGLAPLIQLCRTPPVPTPKLSDTAPKKKKGGKASPLS